MRRSLRLAVLAFGASLLTAAGAAEAQQKLVVYSANDSTLNDLVFAAFGKESGIQVEPVSTGSGVLVKRLQAEKDRPAGRHHLGRQPRAAASQQGAISRPMRRRTADAVPAQFRDPDGLWIGTNVHLLVILQNTKALPEAERPEGAGATSSTRNARARSPSPTRRIPARPIPTSPCWRAWGGGDAGWEKAQGAARQHAGAQPLDARVPGRRQRRVPARHVARICRLRSGPQRRAGEGDLSGGRHHRADGGRRGHQGRAEHRTRRRSSSTTSRARTCAR